LALSSILYKSTKHLSYNPDRADILWALGRLLRCPQIKARAGKWCIEKPKSVVSEIEVKKLLPFLHW
jgi:hypothetical protein